MNHDLLNAMAEAVGADVMTAAVRAVRGHLLCPPPRRPASAGRPIMDWAGWAVFGLVATTGLTAVMIGAQLAGRTRLDLPLMLGTITTEDPDRARVAGFAIHLAIGQLFALFYAAGFAALDRSDWWFGVVFGLAHAAVALAVLVPLLPGVHPRMASERAGPDSTAVLEPPGCSPSTTAPPPRWSPSPPTSSTAPCSDVPRERMMRRVEPTALRADRRLRPDRRHPLRRARGPRWFDRLVVRSRASTTRRCSVGSSAATRPAGSRSAPTKMPRSCGRATGPTPPTLTTTWSVDGGELELADALVAEVEGRFCPSTVLVRRLTARGRAGQLPAAPRPPLRLRPPARRRASAAGPARSCANTATSPSPSPPTAPAVATDRPVDFEVRPGEPVTIVAHRHPPRPADHRARPPSPPSS